MNYLLNTEWMLAEAQSRALPSINQANLNPTRYTSIKIPLPPKPEQVEIVKFLSVEIEKIDLLIDEVKETINRLQEYRGALISAAVTGKIDVREW